MGSKSSLDSFSLGRSGVSPVGGFVSGLRLADSDLRERRLLEQTLESQRLQDDVRRLQVDQAGMELDDYKAGQSLRDMERAAKETQALSLQALQAIDQVPDEQLGPMVADYMTRVPLHGDVRYQDGKLVDVQAGQQAAFVPNREAIKKMMLNMADPKGALEAVRAEYTPRQYVVDGQVVSMTPRQAAQTQGARMYDDVNAGVTLGKGYADIEQSRASAASSYANANKTRLEAKWVGPKAQADIDADNALALERQAGAKAKAAEIPGKQAEATEKQSKALRDETDFILKQLKLASGADSGVGSFMDLGEDGTRNMMATLEAMATNAPVLPDMPTSMNGASAAPAQPVPKYSAFEQQAATKALKNLQALGAIEDPVVTKTREVVRAQDIDRLSGQIGPDAAAKVVDSRAPEFLKGEQFRLMDMYGPVKGQQEFMRIYAHKAPRH